EMHPEISHYFKTWWTRLFNFLGKLSYHHADIITTLFRGNQIRQMEYGASLSKMQIIPNGISLQAFSPDRMMLKAPESRPVIGMVGRIVSIKDVKTFIKSLLVVKERISNFEAYLIGPYEEDPDYFEECKKLITLLDLDDNVIFTGKANVHDYYPKFDVLVMTSISEGQPLVLLEAMAMGIPLIATDVGACRELIIGHDLEDQAIGVAGIVLPMGSVAQIGEAILTILSDRVLARQWGQNGRQRVVKYYTEEHNIRRYLNLYNHYMAI
ncbi:MAG: GT4 family glycosyltransferase PelF, partial [Bdellovibrionota bacterium]